MNIHKTIISLANNNKPQNFIADAINNGTEACKKAQQIIADAANQASELSGNANTSFSQLIFNPFSFWTSNTNSTEPLASCYTIWITYPSYIITTIKKWRSFKASPFLLVNNTLK